MKIHNARCFGATSNSGNEAIIIQNANLNVKERLLFTQSQNKPVCVFIEHTNNESEIKLDYYYPHKRSPLCLHGTLAAAHIYFVEHENTSDLTCIASMTGQKIAIEKREDDIFITVEEQIIDNSQIKLDAKIVGTLLNADSSVNFLEYYIASSGSPKLLVEVTNLQLLYSLQPDLNLINKWSALNKINGVYAYCQLSETEYSGRNFNHLNPILEDSATGVAVTALTYHLKRDLIVYQGAATKNECVMYAKFLNNKVQISGNVLCEELSSGKLY